MEMDIEVEIFFHNVIIGWVEEMCRFPVQREGDNTRYTLHGRFALPRTNDQKFVVAKMGEEK